MSYTVKFYAYLFAAGVVICVITARWLSGVGLPLVIVIALVYSYAVILFGRWLFGRKNL